MKVQKIFNCWYFNLGNSLVKTSLPNNKILDQSILIAFADEYNMDITGKLKFVLGRAENIAGKEENVGNQHFFLFLQLFSKGFLYRGVKNCDSLVKTQILPCGLALI